VISETPAFEPIRIIEIIADEIGQPRNDGTPGSALYSVPFRLSARAPADWGAVFVRNWDNPREFTAMHRPGIASVSGDRVYLERTTVEEVEKIQSTCSSRPLEQRRSSGGRSGCATAADGSPKSRRITIAPRWVPRHVTDKDTSADHPSGKNAY